MPFRKPVLLNRPRPKRKHRIMNSEIILSEYVTPPRHGEILLWPQLEQMPRDLRHNVSLLNRSESQIMGESLGNIRAQTRNELLELARQYHQEIKLPCPGYDGKGPLIVTGHQCQFIHCGILIKYILIDYLARARGGAALNISVDSDIPRNVALKLPLRQQQELSVRQIALTNIKDDLPLEYQARPGSEEIKEFIRRLRQANISEGIAPAVENLEKALSDLPGRAETRADFFNLLNHHLAGQLGVRWAELPLSYLGQSDAFMFFAADLLLKAHQVWRCYNQALMNYRRIHKIRNLLHPMPALKGADEADDDIQELPLWIFRRGQARRPLFLGRSDGNLIISDGQKELMQLPEDKLLKSGQAVVVLKSALQKNKLQLRPRALTLTIFARLFLADYFVHGIGGARYDRVADEFIRQYYQTEPPAFAACSATMHLPLGDYPECGPAAEKLRGAQHQRRDWKYNPQRYITDSIKNAAGAKLQTLLIKRAEAIKTSEQLRQSQAGREQRRRVFEKIRQLNLQIVAAAPQLTEQLDRQIQAVQRQYRQAQMAHDREYFFGLFSPEMLGNLLLSS